MGVKTLLLVLICVFLSSSSCALNCTKDKELLNCTLCDLQEVPNSWENENYTIVDLSRNDISQVSQLPYSESIKTLVLSHNNITEILNRAFSDLINIKIIDLSFNYLTYTNLSPLVFQGRASKVDYEPLYLDTLILSHNSLHALGARAFEHLPSLSELYLDHNPFNVLDAVTISAITNAQRNLRILDLSYCGFESIPEGFLHTLSHLEILYLDGNQFINIPSTLNEASKSLLKLSINDNPLEETNFPEMKNLQVLNMSTIDTIYVIRNNSFKNLPALTTFACNFNAFLRKIESNAFCYQQNLTEIHLRSNALSFISEDIGIVWEQLEVLDIRNNPWNCDCNLAWLTQNVVPYIVLHTPGHANALRCSEPDVVAGVQLAQMPLRACSAGVSVTRRMAVLLVLLLIMSACGMLLLAGQWVRKKRHPPPPGDTSDQEDVVHYVRIYNPKD